LLGLITAADGDGAAADGAADGGAADAGAADSAPSGDPSLNVEYTGEGEIPFYWNSDNAMASEKKDTDENPLLDKSGDGGAIMAACFGLQSCAGFRQEERELIYTAREYDCNVKRTQTETGRKDSTSALALTNFELVCPQLKAINQLPRPYDAMPVTFNYPVRQETLDVNGDNFIVTLADGSMTRPKCAILDPAGEGNE